MATIGGDDQLTILPYLDDEVLRAAGSKIDEYLKEEKLQIFAQPMAIREETPKNLDMNNPAEVDFSFEIGLKPDFEIPAVNGKPVKLQVAFCGKRIFLVIITTVIVAPDKSGSQEVVFPGKGQRMNN